MVVKKSNEKSKKVDMKNQYLLSADAIVAKYATEFFLEVREFDMTLGFGQKHPLNENHTSLFTRVVIPKDRVKALIDLLTKYTDANDKKKK